MHLGVSSDPASWVTVSAVTIFLCGDVMMGRGIDQIMVHPGDSVLYEQWARSAVHYVDLAEQRNGPIPRAVEPEYVWGDALEVLADAGVAARIINLETAVTDRGEPWPGKGIHYRMHPANLNAIVAAEVDCCVLANNHVLDWSYAGLAQTLDSTRQAELGTVGAGSDLDSATNPGMIDLASGSRIVVVAVGMRSSGIPASWAAGENHPGVAFANAPSDHAADAVADSVATVVEPGDLVIASIHWGPNWGYDIPGAHRRFAHRLVDKGGVHIIHGHSSHHPLGVEVYHGRLILYGCGDLINDYEGIQGHEEYRPHLGIVYLASVEPASGTLDALQLIPMRLRRFRLEHAPAGDVRWLAETLDSVSRRMGVGVETAGDGLRAVW